MFILFSCQKVELPEILNEDKETNGAKKEDTRIVDSTYVFFRNIWDYNCTISLANGEIVDSSSVSVGDYVQGIGTRDNPYTVYDFLCGEVFACLSSGQDVKNVWLTGYIVGYIQGRSIAKAVFEPGNVSTNIILGISSNETDCERCVPIQLPAGSYSVIRESLNLVDNPNVWGRKVTILGNASVYMSTIGLKSPKDFFMADDF